MNSVCVTGASGFIGRALCAELVERGIAVRGAVRSSNPVDDDSRIEFVAVGEIGAGTDWSSALADVDCVIHCAARAHVIHETETDALAAYRAVNVDGTRRLAEQATVAGVRRIVYLSSIKVNGERTHGSPRGFAPRDDDRAVFTHMSTPAPEDPYGISKWEAEQALWTVSANTGLEVVVVRPPLVYGPGAKGNLARLLKLVCSGVPLPLGAVRNQRSLIGLDNLIDLLIRCSDHPAAAGQTLLVSDGRDISTPDLLRQMAAAMGCSTRLWPIPISMLKTAGYVFQRERDVEKLVGSLRICSTYVREILNWKPIKTLENGIADMVRSYLVDHEGKKNEEPGCCGASRR